MGGAKSARRERPRDASRAPSGENKGDLARDGTPHAALRLRARAARQWAVKVRAEREKGGTGSARVTRSKPGSQVSRGEVLAHPSAMDRPTWSLGHGPVQCDGSGGCVRREEVNRQASDVTLYWSRSAVSHGRSKSRKESITGARGRGFISSDGQEVPVSVAGPCTDVLLTSTPSSKGLGRAPDTTVIRV